jgi:hypothetical protein
LDQGGTEENESFRSAEEESFQDGVVTSVEKAFETNNLTALS